MKRLKLISSIFAWMLVRTSKKKRVTWQIEMKTEWPMERLLSKTNYEKKIFHSINSQKEYLSVYHLRAFK